MKCATSYLRVPPGEDMTWKNYLSINKKKKREREGGT